MVSLVSKARPSARNRLLADCSHIAEIEAKILEVTRSIHILRTSAKNDLDMSGYEVSVDRVAW